MVFMKTPSFLLIGSLLSVLSIAREAAAVELVGDWKQCGGNGYTGPTTCAGSSVCTEQNEWYHQCVPSTTLTGAPTTTTRAPNCPTFSCNAPCATGWYQVTTLPGASCPSCLCLPVTSTSTTVPTTAVVPTGGSNCPIFSCNAPCATGWYQVTTLPGASCGSCLCLPITSANAAEATPVKAAAEMVITPAPAA